MKEYKYLILDFIAYFVFLILGFSLIIFNNDYQKGVILIFSFVIILSKIGSAYIFKGIFRKIVMGFYWIFFIITCVGFILSFMELKLDNYEYNIINVKNDNNGFITNTSVDINNDPIPVKIIKPNIFSIDSENNINVIYKKDNMKTMYYLYDTNIGLHIFYVGSSYLYSYSSFIFIFLLIGAIFFEIIPSVIKLSKSK